MSEQKIEPPPIEPPATSAALCRANGWGPGTVLEGEVPPFYGHDRRIRITAVGEAEVLACDVAICWRRGSGDWSPWVSSEWQYDLAVGTWKAVAPEPAAGGEEASELERLRAFADAHEAWEAKLVMCDEAWECGQADLPSFTWALWDEALEVQALRNKAKEARP